MTEHPNFWKRIPATHRHFRVGLVVLLCTCLCLGAALGVSEAGFGTSQLRVEFAHAAGVRQGDAVRIAGIDIGSVDQVTLRGDHIELSLEVDESTSLGSQTTASIRLATILGTRFVALEPHGTAPLRDRTIPLQQTSVPFDLADLIDTGTPILAEVDSTAMREALDSLNAQFQDTPALIPEALEQISRVSDIVNSRNDQIAALARQSATVAALFERNTTVLGTMVSTGTALAGTIVRQRQVIEDVLNDLHAVTTEVGAVVSDNTGPVATLLGQLDQLTAGLNGSDRDIGNLLEALPVFARHLSTATGNGPYMDAFLGASIISDNILCRLAIIEGCS